MDPQIVSRRHTPAILGTYLPGPDVGNSLAERALEDEAQFERVAADLHQVVDESTESSQREGRGEQHNIAELNKHLQVVGKRPIILYKK